MTKPTYGPVIEYEPFMYDDFSRTYDFATTKPDEVGRIWEFDRSLSLFFLDYILLNEQLFKAAFVRTVDKAFPDFSDDFQHKGISFALKKCRDLQNVDMAIFMKAKIIGEEKQIKGNVNFGTLVNFLSLNAFKNMIKQVSPELFGAFVMELNRKQKEPLTEAEIIATVEVIHFLRNIAAHNGQLIHRPTLEILRLYTTDNSLHSVAKIIAKPLSRALVSDLFLSSYQELLAAFADVNDRFKLWT